MEAIVTEKQVSIYALIDPVSGETRYIGKANDAQKRFQSHLRETRRKTPVYCWIGSLRERGLVPELKVIAVCEQSEWEDREREAIADARSKGLKLLNVADGGDQPYCSKETRAENGRKNSKARVDDPWKAYIWKLKYEVSHLLKQGYGTNEDRALLRNAAKVRPDLFACYANLKDLEEGSEAYKRAYPSKYLSDELKRKYEQGKRAYREKARRANKADSSH